MKSLNKFVSAGALAIASALSSAPASAALLLDDWTIDLTSVGGAVVTGVDFMGFNDAPFWSRSSNGGATYTVTGMGSISQLGNDFSGNITPAGLGVNSQEITFVFNVDVANTGVTAGGFTFTHIAGANTLSIYIQDISGVGNPGKATPGNGTGYTDGTLVAVFDVMAGGGGGVNFSTLDGSDDATFVLSQLVTPGVLKDGLGNDLTVGKALGLTDSNFDLDSNNNGIRDETRGGFAACAPGQAQTDVSFCGVEDGTIRLANVPEPGTVALLGGALLGLVGLRRKVAR